MTFERFPLHGEVDVMFEWCPYDEGFDVIFKWWPHHREVELNNGDTCDVIQSCNKNNLHIEDVQRQGQ